MININNFFTFSSTLSSLSVHVYPVGLKEFHPIDPDKIYLFDEHRLIQGNYNDILFPVRFKQEYGNKLQDILDTGWAGLYLISDKMKSVLEENNFTGWKTFPVNVLNKQGQEIKSYHGFSVTGRCGKIDYTKSETIEKRLFINGSLTKYYKGLHIGLDEWDNTDFFLPKNCFGIIITKQVCEIFKKNKMSNIKFVNLADIETDDFTVQTALKNSL